MARTARETRSIRLASSDALTILPLVERLYTAQVAGLEVKSDEEPAFLASSDGKSVVVTGSAAQIERVEKIISIVDEPEKETPDRQTRSVNILGHNATELIELVRKVDEAQTAGKPAPPGGAPTLVAGADGKRILITGTADQLERIEGIVRQIEPLKVEVTDSRGGSSKEYREDIQYDSFDCMAAGGIASTD